MNDFIKRTKADNKTMKKVSAVEEIYSNQSRRMEFRDKISMAVYTAIMELHTKNDYEEQMKNEYLSSINKFLANYDQLDPLMKKFLKDKGRKER